MISFVPKYSVWKMTQLRTVDFMFIIILEKLITTLWELTKLKSNPKTPGVGGRGETHTKTPPQADNSREIQICPQK